MSNQQRVIVTGATGFIGRALVETLFNNNYQVIAAVRYETSFLPIGVEQLLYKNICSDSEIIGQAEQLDCVIHTAARVHIMHDDSQEPLEAFRQVNVEGTLNLARQAAVKGVKRFIYISSIKVNGETTLPKKPFTAEDTNVPIDPYGLSKYEAEKGLLKLSQQTDMEVVIIRPPLVYGPGVKANFSAMLNLIKKGLPMPFGTIDNQRSLIALDNLVSFITHCISHPKAANEIFLISDGVDVSTTV
ncbi:MAG: NAD-dependent epimerase/dehydratase family protein, partial [Flavobacteriaceae bacterium]|nr:NAD-dependent epimerase/dehydratase family protein [Flavobacteriaceae bacterium]